MGRCGGGVVWWMCGEEKVGRVTDGDVVVRRRREGVV